MCPSNNTPQAERASIGAVAARAGERAATLTGSMRASDVEREAAAGELRAHAAAGRLELDELEARLESVLGARTHAEVASALSDLPAVAPAAAPAAHRARRAEGELHAYAMVMLLLLTIWLLTGAGHFWPLYPALGWGLPLMLGRSCAARRQVTSGS